MRKKALGRLRRKREGRELGDQEEKGRNPSSVLFLSSFLVPFSSFFLLSVGHFSSISRISPVSPSLSLSPSPSARESQESGTPFSYFFSFPSFHLSVRNVPCYVELRPLLTSFTVSLSSLRCCTWKYKERRRPKFQV